MSILPQLYSTHIFEIVLKRTNEDDDDDNDLLKKHILDMHGAKKRTFHESCLLPLLHQID